MLSLFRNNQVTTVIPLLLFAALLHLPGMLGYIVPESVAEGECGMLYRWIFGWTDQSPKLSALAATLLVFLQAILINWLVNVSRVNPERNWLAPFFYIFIGSFLPDFQFVSAPLVAVTFYPLLLRLVFGLYKVNEPSIMVFDSGILLAIAALFYLPAIWFAPIVLLSLTHLRSLKFREIMVFFAGLFTPWLLGWAVAVFNNQGGLYRKDTIGMLWQFWDFELQTDLTTLVRGGMLLFIFLVVLFGFGVYYHKRLMQVQKYNNILYWMIFTTIATLFLRNSPHIRHFLLAATPVSIFLALSFQHIKNKAIAEVLFLFLLAISAVVLIQF